jgi:MATE family multidrug resistance protein
MIGLGRGRHILLFNLISVLLNIVFNYVFIFGKCGFPAMGIEGAGWGMTVSNFITAILIVATVFLKSDYRPYFRDVLMCKAPSYLFELLRIGIPMGAMYCVEVGFFMTMTLLMGSFGSQFLAANQIAMQYVGLFINHGVKPRRSGRGCKPAVLTLMWRALLFNISSDY